MFKYKIVEKNGTFRFFIMKGKKIVYKSLPEKNWDNCQYAAICKLEREYNVWKN